MDVVGGHTDAEVQKCWLVCGWRVNALLPGIAVMQNDVVLLHPSLLWDPLQCVCVCLLLCHVMSCHTREMVVVHADEEFLEDITGKLCEVRRHRGQVEGERGGGGGWSARG